MCSITEPVHGKGPCRFLALCQPARGRRVAGSPALGAVDAVVLWLLLIIFTVMAGEGGGLPAVSLLAALQKHLGDCDRRQRPASPSPGKSGISVSQIPGG